MSKIWPGAFFDRFMPYKLGVLANPDPMIKTALESQSDALERLSEKPELHDFEFTVSDRDHHGRIAKVVARRIVKQSPKGVTR